jgi:hypothetical protein
VTGDRAARTNRLGFVVDVVSYGQRSGPEQARVRDRLRALLRTVVADIADDVDQVDQDICAGDGMVVLPGVDDPAARLPALLRSIATRLASDNAAYGDRIRLRMAVGAGQGARGFTGPMVVNINRLVDSEPLRRAAADNPGADLVVLVLHVPGREVVAPGDGPLVPDCVEVVDLAMKRFVDRAWLWVSSSRGL